MAYAFRTRFKKEIVAEFLPPARPTKKQRVVIICDGMPTMPSKLTLIEFLSKKGYWVFHPRYRGSWESDGVFLKKSPEEDVLDVIDTLPRGFKNLWDGHEYRVQPDEIFIIASSFGGPAGILTSRDSRVTKVIAISPVVDWQAPSKEEPLDWLGKFVRDAFGNGYRFSPREWKKLSGGKFYNPVSHVTEINGSKLFIFHAYDDKLVRWNEVAKFARTTGATLKLFKKGGHLSSRTIITKHWVQIAKFLKKP
jgi:pimeloyl-ACP methyl ester carboxylesterase